jgi:hypothetical protein
LRRCSAEGGDSTGDLRIYTQIRRAKLRHAELYVLEESVDRGGIVDDGLHVILTQTACSSREWVAESIDNETQGVTGDDPRLRSLHRYRSEAPRGLYLCAISGGGPTHTGNLRHIVVEAAEGVVRGEQTLLRMRDWGYVTLRMLAQRRQGVKCVMQRVGPAVSERCVTLRLCAQPCYQGSCA